MAVKKYSYRIDANKKLSKNFCVKEFRCKDGSDAILVDEKLVKLLQLLRNKFGEINISSAYRTAEYNKKVGGVASSQHLYGKAADCTFKKGIELSKVAEYAEKIGFSGIGLDDRYKNFIHLDTRSQKSFFRYNSNGSTYSVGTFLKSKSYSVGTYEVTASILSVRKGAGTNYKTVQYKDLTDNAKKQMGALSIVKTDGYIKKMKCSVSEIKGNWGKTPSGWICLDYCKKV